MCQKRIFIGSFVKHKALDDLFEISKKILEKTGVFKWTRTPDNFHITFHFFGTMSCNDIEKLRDVLQDFSRKEYDFDLQVQGLSFFKRKGRPSVLYAGLLPNEDLHKLYQSIQNRLFKTGFINEIQTKFAPHITFARIKKTLPSFEEQLAHINQKFEPVMLNPLKIEIIESVLSPEGALYRGI